MVATAAVCITLAAGGCAGHHLSGSNSSATATPTPAPSSASSGVIRTIAGTAPTAGYTGDNAAATAATLNDPTGSYVDSAGNVYIADHGNNVVRVISAAGTIATFAGNGTPGYSGDGAAATSAEMSGPQCVFGDSSGNIYVVESGNVGYSGGNVVREINASGIISTVAGNGTAGFSGDKATAVSAELSAPQGGCIDTSGNIYIADTGNNRIREVNATTGLISTVVGTGVANYLGDKGIASTAALDAPTDVKIDSIGNLYIDDRFNNRVREVAASTNIITTLAGSGVPPNNKAYTGDGAAATAAELNLPASIALDSSGNVYIADLGNNAIREVLAATGIITTVVGNGTAGYSGDGASPTAAELKIPAGITVVASSGILYIADSGNNVVRKLAP